MAIQTDSKWSSLSSVATLAAALALCATVPSAVQASTLQEPGYTETVIGSIAEATNGFGGMITDADGNLYFAANFANEIYKAPPGGPLAQFGSVAGTTANGVAIIGGTLYSSFTQSNQVYAQSLSEAAPAGTLVGSVSGPMGMAVAPAGFGAFGGQLIIGTVSNGIVAMDVDTGTVTPVSNAYPLVSDVAFTADGRLLALPANGELVEVAADGSATVFASGLGAADGLDVHAGTGEIFLAEPNAQSILKVSSDGQTVTAFATDALVDGGFYPSPIAFTVDGTSLFYGTRESGTTVYRIDGFESSDLSGTLRVLVTKTFSNGAEGDVEVTLTCNGGIPLTQSFTISGGGPGVTFTVTDLPDTGADCAVTESGGNEGYTADLSACSWTGVIGGARSCPIENVPEPTAVTVNTTVEGEDDAAIDTTFTTTIVCENVSADTGPSFGTVTEEDTSGMFEADWYADPVNGTDCTVTMVPNDMAVEGDSCSFSFAIGDDEAGCDVAGTVFFEGIPTLSQYGLALLALLMLGVGFVGMRRFV